jgi:uncharacterized protein (DUF2236 family)
MIVTRREFDDALARVRREVKNPAHGLFGPDSVTWRISRDAVVFLGAGRAALLQLAHPYVAHAIAQHSETQRDPVGRFNRTFVNVYEMIFGDLETALASAQRVRGVHEKIHGPVDEDVGRYARGHRYHANDAGALVWVYATLVETSVMAYELGFGELSRADKERYYEEITRFAWLFGLQGEALPATWREFEAYCARMYATDELAVGRPARQIGEFLLSDRRPPLGPFVRWYRVLTAGMLPPRLREGFGLSFSAEDERAYRKSIAALRRGWRFIPEHLRLRPEYIEARRRIAGKPRAARVERALEQVVLRVIKPTG